LQSQSLHAVVNNLLGLQKRSSFVVIEVCWGVYQLDFKLVSLKYWLMFVSKMKRKRAKRSDVMQLRAPVLNPESSVRIPFAARPDVFERAAPRLENAMKESDGALARPDAHHNRPDGQALMKPFHVF
jgi:hypothetical protein